jgi:uncharacterized membrane protein
MDSLDHAVPAPLGAERRAVPGSATVGAARLDRLLLWVTRGLALLGVGIGGYLTYVHYTGLTPVCGISHGCETVQTSQWAYLAGVPVALLGLISYVVILGCSFVRDERALLGGYAVTMIGFAFSAYLTYRELFSIHAICSWCVSSAIVLMLLTIVGTVRVWRAEL